MIITFDGHSGAGKTTQASKIASLLNLKRVVLTSLIRITSEFYVGAVERFPWELSFDNVLRNLSIFRGMQQGQRGWNKGFVLDDDFFKVLVEFRRSKEKAEILNLFRKALVIENGREPDASFYLHVDSAERQTRRIYRDQKDSPNIYHVDEIKISNTAAPQEHEHFNFWEWLASEVPYLHIIDGTQDEETVTSDIVTILGERRLLIN